MYIVHKAFFREEEYCEGCQSTLRGAKRRFTCSSCSAAYHPSCAVSTGSSKWTKADISRWKCENCAYDETPTPAGNDTDSLASSTQQRSSNFNDSDAGSEIGQSSATFDRNDISSRLAAMAGNAITSTRTGRVVKRPKSFEELDADPSK